ALAQAVRKRHRRPAGTAQPASSIEFGRPLLAAILRNPGDVERGATSVDEQQAGEAVADGTPVASGRGDLRQVLPVRRLGLLERGQLRLPLAAARVGKRRRWIG